MTRTAAPIPARLNGDGLRVELAAAGVVVDPDGLLIENDELLVEHGGDPAVVRQVVAAHTGKRSAAAINRDAIQAELITAVDYFSGNYASWPTMTAADKDKAARNAQRALGRISRWLLGQFDQTG